MAAIAAQVWAARTMSEQTLSKILVEMDGFGTDTNVIDRVPTPDILDGIAPPGRFDRRVTMDRPDVVGRRAILNVHVKASHSV